METLMPSVVPTALTLQRNMTSGRVRSSTPNIPRNSALAALMEDPHKKLVVDRLFYVANFSPERTTHREIVVYYDRVLNEINQSHLGETISGLLLLYPSCIIQIIESSSEILYAILQDLVEIQQQSASSMLQNAKILVISHSVQSRLFTEWNFHIISFPTVYLENPMDRPSTLTLLEDTLTSLLKLGAFLADDQKPRLSWPGQNLYELVPELIVRDTTVYNLIKSNELLTPQKFLEMYNCPLHFTSASDHVWPAAQHFYLY